MAKHKCSIWLQYTAFYMFSKQSFLCNTKVRSLVTWASWGSEIVHKNKSLFGIKHLYAYCTKNLVMWIFHSQLLQNLYAMNVSMSKHSIHQMNSLVPGR